MTVVVATGNPGKAREFARLLEGFHVKTPEECGVVSEPEETGDTFLENALIKARAVCAETGIPAIADDSGLCVDALNGVPGVRSARFAEPGRRKAVLLGNMREKENRKARFVTAVALVYPDGREVTAEGVCEGEIALEARGENGFGYDPVFFLPEMGRTMAELTDEEKNAVSHRGKAIRALLDKL